MRSPYAGLPAHQIWSRAVSGATPDSIDPQIAARFTLTERMPIASAGSCFAQRIAERLQESGYNYFVSEQGPLWESPEWLRTHNYGTYSARFGDIFTTLQLVQLAQRAIGQFLPEEQPWASGDRFLDPFRPRIQPEGFASREELTSDRARHLQAVKAMLTGAEVFVFTLGLTETWCTRADGAALPICPGAGVGTFENERYAFHNSSVEDNVANLEAFLAIAWALNPKLRVILSVSPVPLAATMEPRHVLASTVWSKSVLRIAAEEVCRRHEAVDYFASYEMVCGAFDGFDGFESDRRSVSSAAVDRVMASFFRAYAGGRQRAVAELLATPEKLRLPKDPCDDDFFVKTLDEQKRISNPAT